MKKIWINVDPKKVDIGQLIASLGSDYEVFARAIPSSDVTSILETTSECDAIISTLELWDDNLLSCAGEKLKLIQKYGMGLDNIDLEAAAKRGIAVANVSGANAAAVAEVALLHILNLGRNFYSCVEGVRHGVWPSTITGTELDGKTVGLLGYGNIAQNLARMLSGFQTRILAYDPYVNTEKVSGPVVMVESREELFAQSDFLSLHVPCTPETLSSIDQEVFGQMKKGAFLVNTCRGKVVNEVHLAQALRNGQLKGAGLDVLWNEPLEGDCPLIGLENVFITSHMGAESVEAGHRSQKIMADTIVSYFRGDITQYVRNVDGLRKYGRLL